MKQNPIPLTLALAPFDRLETLSKVASRLDTLHSRASEIQSSVEILIDKLRAAKHTALEISKAVAPLESQERDVRAEIDALQALHDLATASTGDTIFLSTHAYSLLA